MDFAVKAGFFGAVFAAIGYVSKLVIEWIKGLTDEHRRRRSQLVQLQSLLRAGFYTYDTQIGHREKLTKMIEQRTGKELSSEGDGYDQFFADSFQSFVASEKELHDIIRAFTIHAMRPVNLSLLQWLRADSYFKAQSGDTSLGKLAGELARLEIHLILWLAKYEVWIPEFKAHALVYLVDEKGHGVGFPVGIDELIPPAQAVLESAFLGRLERISDRLGA
jgi:hypothetical protein